MLKRKGFNNEQKQMMRSDRYYGIFPKPSKAKMRRDWQTTRFVAITGR
jgi:hypothetical protein